MMPSRMMTKRLQVNCQAQRTDQEPPDNKQLAHLIHQYFDAVSLCFTQDIVLLSTVHISVGWITVLECFSSDAVVRIAEVVLERSKIHSFANKFGFARDSSDTQLNRSFVMFPGNWICCTRPPHVSVATIFEISRYINS
ncbi:hypothetical protein CSKR_100032 [Clonorchis sinensis]|uniref:Uncharacterized protein n=1 Tax=Clonorchis sinensis TaxID=79923 RepID=A0A419QC81_CLOSI|nr:hypothetical protein CSKR_100032 [Clonorchis sinensis]